MYFAERQAGLPYVKGKVVASVGNLEELYQHEPPKLKGESFCWWADQPYLKGLWQQLEGGTRQHPQQLLERQEGLPKLKGNIKLLDVCHVRDHRGEMVWEKPGPRCNPSVVVLQHPVQALYETSSHPPPPCCVVLVHPQLF